MPRDYTHSAQEHVIYDGSPSWWAYWKGLTIALTLTAVSAGVLFPLLAWPWLKRKSTRHLITNDRVMIAQGILNKHTTEFRVDNVRQIKTGATWMERLQGYGHLDIEAHTGAVLHFAYVPNHQEVANNIRRNQSGAGGPRR